MELRNMLYAKGIKESFDAGIPVLSVGNLSAGGTGKTPFIELLLGMARDAGEVAVVSRGYGRHTQGLLELAAPLDPGLYGDEPCQIKTLFPTVTVVVSEDRAKAFEYLKECHPKLRLILLDDAFQNLRVKRDLNILLTAYDMPFFQDWVLPAGNLREFRKNAARADMVVVTKGPEHPDEVTYTRAIKEYAPKARIVFSRLSYGAVSGKVSAPVRALVLTSIANPHPLYAHLRALGIEIVPFALPDHASYTADRLSAIGRILKDQSLTTVLTTTKDAVKLASLQSHPSMTGVTIRIVPVAHTFYHDADAQFFKTLIASYA